MGFAVSAVLATAAVRHPANRFRAMAVTGDGSFTMNPQVLIDGAAHGAKGVIVLLDNRRMGAISTLQQASIVGPGGEHATWDHVAVDYVAWGRSVEGGPRSGVARPSLSWCRRWKKHCLMTGFRLSTYRCTGAPTPWAALVRGDVGTWAASPAPLKRYGTRSPCEPGLSLTERA